MSVQPTALEMVAAAAAATRIESRLRLIGAERGIDDRQGRDAAGEGRGETLAGDGTETQ
jgi:hypothetical protein